MENKFKVAVNATSRHLKVELHHDTSYQKFGQITLAISRAKKTATVLRSNILPEEQGKGYGKVLYYRAGLEAKKLGLDFIVSDFRRTEKSEALWKSLARKESVYLCRRQEGGFQYFWNLKEELKDETNGKSN